MILYFDDLMVQIKTCVENGQQHIIEREKAPRIRGWRIRWKLESSQTRSQVTKPQKTSLGMIN